LNSLFEGNEGPDDTPWVFNKIGYLKIRIDVQDFDRILQGLLLFKSNFISRIKVTTPDRKSIQTFLKIIYLTGGKKRIIGTLYFKR
jgi:hypothetical protein